MCWIARARTLVVRHVLARAWCSSHLVTLQLPKMIAKFMFHPKVWTFFCYLLMQIAMIRKRRFQVNIRNEWIFWIAMHCTLFPYFNTHCGIRFGGDSEYQGESFFIKLQMAVTQFLYVFDRFFLLECWWIWRFTTFFFHLHNILLSWTPPWSDTNKLCW